ncbi:MAG: 4Fe-4S dicluster domain-containing protein [Methanomassiliicoccales archaeon]|nr:MAG: 4Fe-4S dicluster domain-containing protein [Methanomassiliicoccales archaeon]
MAEAAEEKVKEKDEDISKDMVTIYIMGKRYEVPSNLTIMKAMEYAGYRFVRGCGCRGGFCGACGTVYRTKDDYKLKAGLACQTVVEEDMYLTQIPFFPANKAVYDLEELEPTAEQVIKLYPEVFRCVSCNTCTKICPQEIEVMNYVNAALRGDISKTADLSFDCISCGLCAARCPAEIVQYNVAILCRRLYARYIAQKAKHLEKRVKEIEDGKFDSEVKKLVEADEKTLRKLYNERDIEPQ